MGGAITMFLRAFSCWVSHIFKSKKISQTTQFLSSIDSELRFFRSVRLQTEVFSEESKMLQKVGELIAS